MINKGIKLNQLQKKKDKYLYRGKFFIPNQPIPSTAKEKKMMVLATKNIDGEKRVRLIHFGKKGNENNCTPEEKKRYLQRSANIRNQKGELTRNDPWSPNYWSRKVLWSAKKTTKKPTLTRKATSKHTISRFQHAKTKKAA